MFGIIIILTLIIVFGIVLHIKKKCQKSNDVQEIPHAMTSIEERHVTVPNIYDNPTSEPTLEISEDWFLQF